MGGQIHRQDLIYEAQVWFDFVRKNPISSRDAIHLSWHATTMVAQIMTGQEILKHKIKAKRIRQAARRSEGTLSYPAIITCLCIEGITFIQGIDECVFDLNPCYNDSQSEKICTTREQHDGKHEQ